MVQMGFFDIAKRYAGLDAKNDPLARIDEVVLWAAFRPRLETVWRRRPEERKSPAGRKPWDAVVMFKAIVLCELYSLSDEQVEYQLRDRLSFMRFLGLGLEDKVPDAKTVWLYREQLARAGVIETLFEDFDGYLKQQGYLGHCQTNWMGPVEPTIEGSQTASWRHSAQGGRAIEFEAPAVVKMTFLVEMIVDRGVGGGEFLQGLDVSEPGHRSLSSAERLV